jgi:hypothetical protein
MAFDIKDFTLGTAKTIRSMLVGGEHYPAHVPYDEAGVELFGRVTASPAANTISDRLKRGRFKPWRALGSTVTRPANTTVYTGIVGTTSTHGDAVSNNATAASVTPITFTFTDTADDPCAIRRCVIDSTDTGLAGNMLRLFLFQTDPTATSGVTGGDNATFSIKKGTFLGTLSGTLRTFTDGSAGVLIPDETEIIALPGSGLQTCFGLFSTPTGFTPSANSTTIIPTLEGYQGRA